MRFLIVAMALLGLVPAAHAGGTYQCSSDAGCTARITEDGVVVDVAFRKGDIVTEEQGYDISNDDGWKQIKTTDGRGIFQGPRPTFVVDDRMAGTTLGFQGQTRVYVPTTYAVGGGGGGAQGGGDSYEISWKHDSDGNGPVYQPQTVTVRCERRTNETIRAHADRFKAMVDAMRDLFPPNVAE